MLCSAGTRKAPVPRAPPALPGRTGRTHVAVLKTLPDTRGGRRRTGNRIARLQSRPAQKDAPNTTCFHCTLRGPSKGRPGYKDEHREERACERKRTRRLHFIRCAAEVAAHLVDLSLSRNFVAFVVGDEAESCCRKRLDRSEWSSGSRRQEESTAESLFRTFF